MDRACQLAWPPLSTPDSTSIQAVKAELLLVNRSEPRPRVAGFMEESSPAVLERLRNIVADCLDKHLHSSAVFFADKLVTLSDGAAEDVFLLAQARGHLRVPPTCSRHGGTLTRSALCSRLTSTVANTGALSRCCGPSP